MQGYFVARVFTRGAGLTMAQRFEALKKSGQNKLFDNVCFVRVENGKFTLLSLDYKERVSLGTDKVISVEILARDLKELQALRKGRKYDKAS